MFFCSLQWEHLAYLHLKFISLSVNPPQNSLNPSKLAIGTDGGFVTEAKYDIIKSNHLVVVTDGGPVFISLPNTELPEFISNVAEAIIQHGGMKSKMQVDSWDSSNEVAISKYAASLVQLPGKGKISQHSASWTCEMSGDLKLSLHLAII